MKCEVIRDLLPSYIDELTSVESNKIIEEHIEQCEECRSYLEETQKGIFIEKAKNDNDIEPFIKIKEKTIRKILLAVIITVMVSAFLYDSWASYIHNGKSIKSEEVEIKLEEKDGVEVLVFEPVDENAVFYLGHTENREVNGETPIATFSLIKRNKHPKFYPASENQYMFIFLEDDTILDLFSYPNKIEFSEEDFFAIQFDDGVKTIRLSELRDGNLEFDFLE